MAIENSKLIDKKSYYHNGELNAVAFIEFFPSGKVQVYGKFYEYYDFRRKKHSKNATQYYYGRQKKDVGFRSY